MTWTALTFIAAQALFDVAIVVYLYGQVQFNSAALKYIKAVKELDDVRHARHKT